MHRSITSIANKTSRRQVQNQLVLRHNQTQILKPSCDVFINHRGVDTKRNVAGLLHDYLSLRSFHPFLDSQTMRPGERLSDRINEAIHECKVGIAVFSPRYCESSHCLHELALLSETGKKLIPIFYDVKPSQLRVADCGRHCSERHAKRFSSALEEARNTVGLTFDSATGDWSKLLRDTLESVLRILPGLEEGWPREDPDYTITTVEPTMSYKKIAS